MTKPTELNARRADVEAGEQLRERCLWVGWAAVACGALLACGGAAEVASELHAGGGHDATQRSAIGSEVPNAEPATAPGASEAGTVSAEPPQVAGADGLFVIGEASCDTRVSAPKPPEGWWKEFAGREAERPRNRLSEANAPRLALQLYGLDSSSAAYRAHRSRLGLYRLCFEIALSKDPDLRGISKGGVLEGHWVARVGQSSEGRILWALVTETTLTEEMSTCLRDEMLYRVRGSAEERQLDMVLTFHFR